MGRLIDADDLHRKLFEYGCHKSKMHPMDVMKMIEEQPTAYDVDKVVEELEEKIKNVEKIIVTPPQDKLDEIANDTAKDFIGAWKSAIKVVRKGGVNE